MLNIKNLSLNFNTWKGVEKVLDGVSFEVNSQEIFGIVGETGCGKSVTALSILRLVPHTGKLVGGEIWFEEKNLLELDEETFRTKIRGNKISMIFQEPMTSLNPLFTVGDQISEVFEIHQHIEKNEARKKTIEILDSIEMPDAPKTAAKYPFELSGGMRQRVMIAMALACKPKLLLADEPTSNLDVATQAQVLELIKELTKTDSSVLLITHSFGVVAELCEKVAVMYAGNIVECGDVIEIFQKPMHPYTVGLLNAIPSLKGTKRKRLETIPGFLPNFIEPPSGCRFHPRCSHAMENCRLEKPREFAVDKCHHVACHMFQ
jgi:peptide/nickel transport system ATP-binding protein/oligopeptide transport system ATP-binding protein